MLPWITHAYVDCSSLLNNVLLPVELVRFPRQYPPRQAPSPRLQRKWMLTANRRMVFQMPWRWMVPMQMGLATQRSSSRRAQEGPDQGLVCLRHTCHPTCNQ